MKKKLYVVIRQKTNDEEWDPDERIGDPHVVAVVTGFGQALETVRKDAEKTLRGLGYSKKDDPELFEDFVGSAENGELCRPSLRSDGEGWRWTVAESKLTLPRKSARKR